MNVIDTKVLKKLSLTLLAALTLSSCGQEETFSEPKSICGSTNDMQDVEQYDGSLGISRSFVDRHESPVGIILNSSRSPYCSGTLISDDLFLTAGHCLSTRPAEVAFNYQVGGQPEIFEVAEILESGRSLDYGIIRIAGAPGRKYGSAQLSTRLPSTSETVVIIQHPAGQQKKVEVGQVSRRSGSRLYYSSLDTLGGSSGSGVLDAQGRLIGIHTNGGCSSRGGSNSGVTISAVAQASSIL